MRTWGQRIHLNVLLGPSSHQPVNWENNCFSLNVDIIAAIYLQTFIDSGYVL